MKLGGLHHVTMITGDVRRNVEFYAETLGLRLVKKTVNFDAPEAYHLYFGDEQGSPGSILTWFDFAGAPPGRPGGGMVHTLELGVATPDALDFWEQRLGEAAARTGVGLAFADPDGLRLELAPAAPGHVPLRAEHPDVPAEHAIVGVVGARAYARTDGGAPLLTETLGFTALGGGAYRLDGPGRRFGWTYEEPPAERGRPGAGTVHHIAWASADEDHVAWRDRVGQAGVTGVTGVIDRDYFRSIYFREPRGILFEIATRSPGFAVDEDPDRLGETLRLPRRHEHLRPQLERYLPPVVNPRTARRDAMAS